MRPVSIGYIPASLSPEALDKLNAVVRLSTRFPLSLHASDLRNWDIVNRNIRTVVVGQLHLDKVWNKSDSI